MCHFKDTSPTKPHIDECKSMCQSEPVIKFPLATKSMKTAQANSVRHFTIQQDLTRSKSIRFRTTDGNVKIPN